jgi:hypothetical protein
MRQLADATDVNWRIFASPRVTARRTLGSVPKPTVATRLAGVLILTLKVVLLVGEFALLGAFAVAVVEERWLVAALVLAAIVLDVWPRSPAPDDLPYWVLAVAMVIAVDDDAMTIFALGAPAGLSRSLSTWLRVVSGGEWRSVEAFLVGPRRRLAQARMREWWRRRPERVQVVGQALTVAAAIAWPVATFWVVYGWRSGWRHLYEILAGLLVWLWFQFWPRVLGIDFSESPPTAVHSGAGSAMAIRAPRYGASASVGAWASDARFTRVDPRDPSPALDYATGFDGPLDERLRQFAADCAEHLLDGRHGRHERRAQRRIARARARADGRLRGPRLAVLLLLARDRVPAERRSDRRSDTADDAACAAFHAFAAPTPLNAADASANCCSVDARGETRDAELAWQRRCLDGYRDHGR